MEARVIAIDDDELFLTAIQTLFSEKNIPLKAFSDPTKAVNFARNSPANEPVKMAIVDLHMPKSGLGVIAELKAFDPNIHVVVLSGDETQEAATSCINAGADHFYRKDKSKETVLLLAEVASIKAKHASLNGVQKVDNADKIKSVLGLKGCSHELAHVADLVMKFANASESVLILGQSGVGKDEVAESLHRNSKRKNGPFIAVNCAAFPREIIERELFGHVKGSFTGAISDQAGKFVAAHGGTLFLDEIGELPLDVQAKLLRVLQKREVTPIGSNHARKVDVRVISATNRSLSNEVKNGRFREDLYFRLNDVSIDVPSLCERRSDIGPIVESVIQKKNGASGQNKKISDVALGKLQTFTWPGNVRELISAVSRAYLLAEDVIELSHFDHSGGSINTLLDEINKIERPEDFPSHEDFKKQLESFERIYLQKAMILAEGKRAQAARLTGLPYMAYIRRREALGLSSHYSEIG